MYWGSTKPKRGRPKSDPEQRSKAYQLFKEGKRHSEIFKALEEKYGPDGKDNLISGRTLSEWIREFKIYDRETGIDNEKYRWHRTEEYGLPWESGAYLLSLMKNPWRQGPYGDTVRDMRWCWRIHLAAPELDGHEVLVLAYHYMSRQRDHEIDRKPLEMDDLDAFLAFKPWRSLEHQLEYLDEVGKGNIPMIKAPNPDLIKKPEETWDSYFRRFMFSYDELR